MRDRIRFPIWLQRTLVILLVVGITFRFVNLNHKPYWHDEVYTNIRAAGYTRGEIDDALFQNRQVAIGELQRFQQVKPGSTLADTIQSLALEDPQHPPLYFSLARLWMQAFGSSLTASRLLPVFLSLLALPLMAALAWELFASPAVALMATTLLALSPFDVLFAQTARQYSLLTVCVIGSQWLLLRALRKSRQPGSKGRDKPLRKQFPWLDWGWYSLSVTVGLYVHPFFGLTLIAQMIYVGLELRLKSSPWRSRPLPGLQPMSGDLLGMVGAIVLALLLYAPWLYVMLANSNRAFATTNWAHVFPGMDYLASLWTLSFTSLFLDLYSEQHLFLTFSCRILVLLVIAAALYTLCRQCDRSIWLAIVTTILVPFLLLVIPDLVLGGKRSAVSRYLVSCYPGIQLAVAYFLASKLALQPQIINRPKSIWHKSTASRFSLAPILTPLKSWFWRGIFALLILGSLASLTVSAASFTWWNKDLSYANPAIADLVRRSPSPIIISDIGDDYTNTGDLISLSYLLDKNTPLLLSSQDATWVQTEDFNGRVQGRTRFVFRPTSNLKQRLEARYPLQKMPAPYDRFWQSP